MNKMAMEFGFKLNHIGNQIVRKSVKDIPRRNVSKSELRAFLKEQEIPGVHLFDQRFYLLSWKDWQEIIPLELTNLKKYYSDFADCDNFIYYFAAHTSHALHFNSVIAMRGNVYDKDSGDFVAPHVFGMIVALDDGKLNLHIYEAQNDCSVLWDKDGKNVAGNWVYKELKNGVIF